MTSTVKITSPNGAGYGTEVTIDGVKVGHLTGTDVSIGVGQANTVRLHMIALAQDIEIEAEIKIGGAVIPPAVEMALLAYLDKKYADRSKEVDVTVLGHSSRRFAVQPAVA
jgi:hypothetical protein